MYWPMDGFAASIENIASDWRIACGTDSKQVSMILKNGEVQLSFRVNLCIVGVGKHEPKPCMKRVQAKQRDERSHGGRSVVDGSSRHQLANESQGSLHYIREEKQPEHRICVLRTSLHQERAGNHIRDKVAPCARDHGGSERAQKVSRSATYMSEGWFLWLSLR